MSIYDSFGNGIEITAQVVVANPNYVYGLQRTPLIHRYDEMNATFYSTAFATDGVVLEPNTHTLILQPIPMRIDNHLAMFQFPATGGPGALAAQQALVDTSKLWHELVDQATGLTVLEMPDASAGRAFRLTSLFDTDESGGFYLNLYRSEAAQEAQRSASDYYTQVLVADGVLGGLRLSLPWGGPPTLAVLTSFRTDGSPIYVECANGGADIPDCGQYCSQQADHTFHLRFLSIDCEGTVVVDIGQGDCSLVVRQEGAYLAGGPLTVLGTNGAARVQYLPLRFNPLGSVISSLKDHGRPLTTIPKATLDADVTNYAKATIEYDIVDGSFSQYAITLDARNTTDTSGLATESPVVRSASLTFPGVTYSDWITDMVELRVRRVEGEQKRFDINSLTLEQSADVVCDNKQGFYTGASGYRACYLSAGLNGDNYRRITGWVGGFRQTVQGRVAETHFRLYGKEHWLKRRKVGFIEPFDGYDFYAAMRLLAQLGGVADYWLQAFPYVLPGRGVDSPYYHFPVGTGLSGARIQFDPRTSIWDAMQQLAARVRAYVGFDSYGFLRIYRWSPSNLGGYMQAFQTVASDYDGEPLYNQLKYSLDAEVDMSDIRSDVVLGSIDPLSWQPVFAHAHNESVVTDLSNPSFIGQDDAYVEINSLLFDSTMQNITLEAITEQTSLPGLNVGLQGYYQHRLNPLDVITVAEPYTLGGIYPFYIMGMNSSYGVNDQAFFGSSQIQGKWLMNG